MIRTKHHTLYCPSGNVSDPAFLSSLTTLHDCGLDTFAIGGGSFGIRGTLSPVLGKLNKLRQLGIFTTNVSGTLPPELGGMAALEVLDLEGAECCGT